METFLKFGDKYLQYGALGLSVLMLGVIVLIIVLFSRNQKMLYQILLPNIFESQAKRIDNFMNALDDFKSDLKESRREYRESLNIVIGQITGKLDQIDNKMTDILSEVRQSKCVHSELNKKNEK